MADESPPPALQDSESCRRQENRRKAFIPSVVGPHRPDLTASGGARRRDRGTHNAPDSDAPARLLGGQHSSVAHTNSAIARRGPFDCQSHVALILAPGLGFAQSFDHRDMPTAEVASEQFGAAECQVRRMAEEVRCRIGQHGLDAGGAEVGA